MLGSLVRLCTPEEGRAQTEMMQILEVSLAGLLADFVADKHILHMLHRQVHTSRWISGSMSFVGMSSRHCILYARPTSKSSVNWLCRSMSTNHIHYVASHSVPWQERFSVWTELLQLVWQPNVNGTTNKFSSTGPDTPWATYTSYRRRWQLHW